MDTEIRTETDRRIVRVGDWTLAVPNGTEEPIIEDIELARRQGYARPRAVRQLIKRLLAEGEISEVCERHTMERSQTPTGGAVDRLVASYWLTEEQALVVVMHSKTDKARAMRRDMIAVFRAALRGLLVPSDVRLMQGELHQLRAELDMLKLHAGRVIGDRNARAFILDPLKEAARLTAIVRGDVSKHSYMRELKVHEKSVRMHVQFPDAIGQKWATLPIERLGNAQAKVAEILARAQKDAAPALQFARAIAQTAIDFAPPVNVALAGEAE